VEDFDLMMEKEGRLRFARFDKESWFLPGKEEINVKIIGANKARPDKSIYIKVPRSKNYGASSN
jgi:hypothetical protein